jgi:hypothetical protein
VPWQKKHETNSYNESDDMNKRELKELVSDIRMRITYLEMRIASDQNEIGQIRAALPIITAKIERKMVLESAIQCIKLAKSN